VTVPATTRYSQLLPPKKEPKPIAHKAVKAGSDEEEEGDDDEVLSEIDGDLSDFEDVDDDASEDEDVEQEDEESVDDAEAAEAAPEPKKKDRKRKRKDEYDDLESKYLSKLADDEEDDTPTEKRRKGEAGLALDGESSEQPDKNEEDEAPIVHESLLEPTKENADIELEKANRTLFLGNVSTEAISSSHAKKKLMSHLSSPLTSLDAPGGPHKVESLRFRSTPFAAGGIPKRAAYITKSLMSETTKSTNAYVVYTTPLAARTALKALNGTVILDRHLRADSVAHPTPTAHRRCVFVGNLGFVDDETVVLTSAEGETTTKKRSKFPADIEEGLWRIFGKEAGKVESVRVPRDPRTRVGKGFAYVQFYDANDVESALLLNGKKFPPMLPRILRVSRAKDPRKTTLAMERTIKDKKLEGPASKVKSTKYKHKATPEQQSLAGRAGRLLGRSGAHRQQRELKGEGPKPRRGEKPDGADGPGTRVIKTPEQIVFEGRRASSTDAKPKDLKLKVKGKKRAPLAKTKGRGAKRASEWRNKGGK
jgi:nucleolar protein 12